MGKIFSVYRIIIENGVYNTGNFNVAINEHLSKYNVTKLPIYYRQFLSLSCFIKPMKNPWTSSPIKSPRI